MARDLDGAIAERSRTLLGLVSIAHLDALGVTRQRRRTLVARGVLIPVHRGVYRHAAHPATWVQTVLAGVLAAGEHAVASHMTAATLRGFEGVGGEADGAVELTVARPHQCRPVAGVVVHRTTVLGPADIDRRRLIPCTTPTRTLCDIAPHVSARQLEAMLDHAVRRNLIWRPQLRWHLDELRRQGRRGITELATLLDRTEGRGKGESWLEQEGLRIIAEAGLPVPRAQVRLRTIGGGIARVDLLWDTARLIAELDGHGTHATRRQRQADAEREARLVLAGWRVVRFTYEDVVERPHYVVATLRAHLAVAA